MELAYNTLMAAINAVWRFGQVRLNFFRRTYYMALKRIMLSRDGIYRPQKDDRFERNQKTDIVTMNTL